MQRVWRNLVRLKRNRVTLMSIPSQGGTTRSISLSYLSLVLLGALGFSVLLAGIGLVMYSTAQFEQVQALGESLRVQKKTNQELTGVFHEQERMLEYLSDRVSVMEDALFSLKDYSQEINVLLEKLGVEAAVQVPDIQEPGSVAQGGPLLEVVATRLETIEQTVPRQEESLLTVHEVLQGRWDKQRHTPTIWPTEGWVSSSFGSRTDPFTGRAAYHEGIDVANHEGTPVRSVADGRVIRAGYMSGYGTAVFIDHGYGIETRYGHNRKVMVKKDDVVSKGQVISLMGNTGRSTGPHLHYEVRVNGKPVSPWRYLPER